MNSGCTLTGTCTDTSATQTCTYTPPAVNCSGSDPCGSTGVLVGSGEITLSSDPTTSTTTLGVSFASTSSQTIGACTYQSMDGGYGYVPGQPVPNEGTVTATTPAFSLSDPQACDGTYSPVKIGQLVDPGAVATFGWDGTVNTSNPTFPNVPAPHAIAVTEPGTLAATGTTLARASDAALTWTPLTPPLSLEQVGFELVQGSKRITCRFPAADEKGVVPADALLALDAGNAQFRMFSLHASSATSMYGGAVSFVVMRQATFSDGPSVAGTLTLD